MGRSTKNVVTYRTAFWCSCLKELSFLVRVRADSRQEERDMVRRFFVIIGFFLAVASARGQGSPPDQAEQQRILLDRIQQLEQRVSELEARGAVSSTPTVPAPGTSVEQKPESQPAAAAQAPSPGPAHEHEARDDQATVRQVDTHYP